MSTFCILYESWIIMNFVLFFCHRSYSKNTVVISQHLPWLLYTFPPKTKRSTFWLTENSQVLAWDRDEIKYCSLDIAILRRKKKHTHTRVFVIMLLIKCLLAARIWWSIIHFIIHSFILWRSASWFWWWKTLSLKWESIKLWTMSWIKRMVSFLFLN